MMSRKPIAATVVPLSTPAPAAGSSALDPTTSDAVLLAAVTADPTLLGRLHGETHRAHLAARSRGEGDGWQTVDARWIDYARNVQSSLHFRDGEPENSATMQAGKLKAMRATLEARQWFSIIRARR